MIKRKGQIEDILLFFALIIIIFSAVIYYFYFKTGSVPVLKPRKEIKPAEKSVIPPGIFFPTPKKEKTPFYKFLKEVEASSFKLNIGTTTKPNYNIVTSIKYKYKDLNNIETNQVEFDLEGKNLKDPKDNIYFAYILIPINKNWQILKSNKLTLTLPKKYGIYILLITAINSKNEYDPTPIGVIFTTKISPYFGDVKIASLINRNTIRLKNISKNEINITNWKIISSMGSFIIPTGVEFVDPKRIYEKKEIILKPEEEVKIMAGYSPLGINFKANKCFNYLIKNISDLKKYLDPISYACDKFSKEELFELKNSGYSLNCVLTLENSMCDGLSQNELKKILNDSRCLNLVYSRFNYNSCYEKRKNDSDFLSKTWYIFLPVNYLYSPRYEEIRLVDQNGLLVDKYIIY